jgi:glucose-1-phosphate adenylyltransferase
MLKKSKVYAYDFKDEKAGQPRYWRDIGNLDAYYEANMDLIDVMPSFDLHDTDWPFRTYQRQFGPAKTVSIEEDTKRIGMALNSLISNGCIISGGKVQSSILSPNIRINSFAEVTGSILMDGVEVGKYAKIRRVIIDKYVKVPEGVELGFDIEKDKKRFSVTNSGIVVVPKGVVL